MYEIMEFIFPNSKWYVVGQYINGKWTKIKRFYILEDAERLLKELEDNGQNSD